MTNNTSGVITHIEKKKKDGHYYLFENGEEISPIMSSFDGPVVFRGNDVEPLPYDARVLYNSIGVS